MITRAKNAIVWGKWLWWEFKFRGRALTFAELDNKWDGVSPKRFHSDSWWIFSIVLPNAQFAGNWQDNVASFRCSFKSVFFNYHHCQLLLWELVPRSSWEDGEIHPACYCDHRLWADRTHFTGRTVTRGAPLITLPCFLSPFSCLCAWLSKDAAFLAVAIHFAFALDPISSFKVILTVI